MYVYMYIYKYTYIYIYIYMYMYICINIYSGRSHKTRRCRGITFPESYITKYTK